MGPQCLQREAFQSRLIISAAAPHTVPPHTLQQQQDPGWMKALGGGLACMMAAVVTNPIDVLKTRLQLQGEGQIGASAGPNKYRGFLQGGWVIFKEEGLGGLYKGSRLPASLLREASYSTIRMGGYDLIKELLGHDPARPADTPLWKKATSGLAAGAAGAAIANPTDLVKVRMQASATSSRYRSVFHAFAEIWRSEGISGLYRGVWPTTQRAALLTASQLASYDHIKQTLLRTGMTEGIALHFACSFCAGFVAAAVTSPVDLVKTRVMNQSLAYASSWDCVRQTARNEGLLGFYKGFFPNWYRIAPHTIVTMMVFEQFRRFTGMRPV